ncbi:MAG: YfhO family protein [Lachnospiraceae bacterium]|nr:YfhO family protein [Lachnospiraceae bacterium]
MRKQWKQNAISFALPIMILIMIFMVWGKYPFGENTLLIWDMDEQYAPFFIHLHDILHGDASALYSFSRALGGNMLSVASYYLISPFNLIFYFFDAENIYVGVFLVIVLKIGMCGYSMHWFLNRKWHDMSAIIFSTSYALCAYVIENQFNIFWIDAMILLPLVCEGIERLVDERKYLLYTLSIAFAVITNFYTGYMICIFSVLYFICYFFFISDKKYRVNTIIIYVAASLMGGMLSMCLSLPAMEIMQNGKTGISLSILKNFKNMFKYRELFDVMFCATLSDRLINARRPLIYCGIFAIIMGVYWFIQGKEAVRKKLAYLLLLFAIVVSFHHFNLDCVWHAFNSPTGSPHRYSFIYVFLVLYIAYKGYISLKDMNTDDKKDNAKTAIWTYIKNLKKSDKSVIFVIGLILCLGLLGRAGSFMEIQKTNIVVLSIFLIAVYAAILLFIKNKALKTLLILFFTCAELFVNAQWQYMSSERYYTSISVDEYQAYMQDMLPLVERAKNDEAENDGIARTAIERSARRTSNDPFLFSIYGLDSYTSMEKQNVINIAGNFGYSNNITWGMHYNNGSTKAAEALLGVKYLISGKNPGVGYNKLEETDEFAIYKNENTLPFAFIADASILEIQSTDDTFKYTNELYQSLDVEQKEDILIKIASEEVPSQPSYLEYEYKTDLEMTVYTRYDRAGISKAEAYIDDELIDLSSQRSDVKCIGILPAEAEFRLRFYLPEDGSFSTDKIFVYGERGDMLKAYARDVNTQPVNITMHNEAYIEISCANEDNEAKYLLCTIPYDKSWRVKVDGKRAEILDAQNFVAIPIESGNHEVELKFIPRGLYIGILVTLVSVFVLILIEFLRKKWYSKIS